MRRTLFTAVSLLVAVILGGCEASEGLSFLSPGGPVAAAQLHHLIVVVLTMLVVILPVLIGVPYIVWRYREGGPARTYAPDWCSSRTLEILVWGVPALLVVLLGVGLHRSTEALDPYAPLSDAAPLHVQAIGLDWKWVFVYPDEGVATVDELVVEAGRPVEVEITSGTVIQSFFVSGLAGQIYAMPGMVTRQQLQADHPGRWVGRNSQFNGAGFSGERFEVRAVEPGAFETWLGEVRGSDLTLDAACYGLLQRREGEAATASRLGWSGEGPVHFGAVTPGFFEQTGVHPR